MRKKQGRGHDALARDLTGIIRDIVKQEFAKLPKPLSGWIVPGSWTPADGTVTVQIGNAAAVQASDGNSPLSLISGVPLKVGAYGHQYGARGYELVTLIQREGNLVAILEHDEDTSPQVEVGEVGQSHYNESGTIDAFWKFKNDAKSGDGKASFYLLVGALLTILTAGGLAIIANDENNTLYLGQDNLDDDMDAVATKRYVQQMIVDPFNSHTHDGVQTGGGVSGTPTDPMDEFTGSDIVKAAP